MWWIRDISVTKGTTRDNPVATSAKLTIGTLRRVLIFFRPGALGFVKVTLWHHEHQFHPENADGYVVGDDYVYDMPVNYELDEVPAIVRVVAWNTAALYDHDITVSLYVDTGGLSAIREAVRQLFKLGGS